MLHTTTTYTKEEFVEKFASKFSKKVGSIFTFSDQAKDYGMEALPYFASGYCMPAYNNKYDKPFITLRFEPEHQVQLLSVLIHEHAHAMLHDTQYENEHINTYEKEIEAESVAKAILDYLGYNTDKCDTYIAHNMIELNWVPEKYCNHISKDERQRKVNLVIDFFKEIVDEIPEIDTLTDYPNKPSSFEQIQEDYTLNQVYEEIDIEREYEFQNEVEKLAQILEFLAF